MEQKKIVIIGAGPTGLGAAYRLKEMGYTNFMMYDRLDHLGGLASSYTDSAGFTWDVGGHVMFSHYEYYDRVFDRLMEGEFTLNELAETVLRITGSESELVYEALPVDDPQVRQPDITRARQLLGWEPQIQLEDGLRRMLPTFGREPVVA